MPVKTKPKPFIMEPAERFGFRWGTIVVSRTCELKNRWRCVTIQTKDREVDVIVSWNGRKISVQHNI